MWYYSLFRQAYEKISFLIAYFDVIREMPGLCTCGEPAKAILEIFVISNQGLFNKFIVQIIPVDQASYVIKFCR